ncbi:hypothetical protein D3C81_1969850 [compost metagenome]
MHVPGRGILEGRPVQQKTLAAAQAEQIRTQIISGRLECLGILHAFTDQTVNQLGAVQPLLSRPPAVSIHHTGFG